MNKHTKPFLASIKTAIKYQNLPACMECRHYLPSTSTKMTEMETGRCTMFREKNLITGKINYRLASIVRMYDTDCGPIGKFFVPLQNPSKF